MNSSWLIETCLHSQIQNDKQFCRTYRETMCSVVVWQQFRRGKKGSKLFIYLLIAAASFRTSYSKFIETFAFSFRGVDGQIIFECSKLLNGNLLDGLMIKLVLHARVIR